MSLGEMLGALSLATDLAAGLPLETALRTCVLATRIAHTLGWAEQQGEIRRAAVLRHIGCTAFAHEAARIAGDDHQVLATYEGVDYGRFGAVAGRTVRRLARGTSAGKRLAAIARLAVRPGIGVALMRAQCEQAVALAEDLEMPPGVLATLAQIYERHDGRGGPERVAGDEIRPAARVLHLAELVEIVHRNRGRDATIAEVRKRRGRHVSAEVVDAFLAEHAALWEVLELPSVWDRYLDADDEPDAAAPELGRIARAFGRFADLKSPYRLGHSTAVAEIAVAVGGSPRVQAAALLHDLGTVSVPNGIWDKPGPLNAAEWERVRLHGYHTQRILSQTPELAEIAALAGAHHERLDGSGYHRCVNASMLDGDARLIAAADAYQAMRQSRAHRDALSAEAAGEALAADARNGRLCGRAVDAVLAVAGLPPVPRVLPAGLTPREAEVLVHLARGDTNKEIARALGITVRTANHHVENIFEKIDVTTRTAAALFAVRHDLVS